MEEIAREYPFAREGVSTYRGFIDRAIEAVFVVQEGSKSRRGRGCCRTANGGEEVFCHGGLRIRWGLQNLVPWLIY